MPSSSATPDPEMIFSEPDPFSMIPETVIFDEELSDAAFRLWIVLKRHCGPTGEIYPSHARVAKLCGWSVAKVRRTKAELVDAGLLRVTARENPQTKAQTSSYNYLANSRPLLTSEHPPCSSVSTPPAHGRAPNENKKNEIEKKSSADKPQAAKWTPEVRALATEVYDARKTAGKAQASNAFPTYCAVAKTFVGQGTGRDRLLAAMVTVPTVSTRSIEFELNRPATPQRRGAGDLDQYDAPWMDNSLPATP